eukprot:UN10828
MMENKHLKVDVCLLVVLFFRYKKNPDSYWDLPTLVCYYVAVVVYTVLLLKQKKLKKRNSKINTPRSALVSKAIKRLIYMES